MVAVGDLMKVTRDDIQDFPGDTIQIIMDLQKDGWRAQRSNRNHVMLFAPDGKARYSASRNKDSAKYLAEDVRRYKRSMGEEEKEPVKVRTVTPKFPCPREDCNRTFNSAENLMLHVGLDHDGLIKCPDCNEMFKKPTGLGRHRQVKHGFVSARYAARKAAEARRAAVDELVKDLEESAEAFEDDRIFDPVKTSAITEHTEVEEADKLNLHVDEVQSTNEGIYAYGTINQGAMTGWPSLVRNGPDIVGASIHLAPQSEDVEHIDFLDERDSWTMNLDTIPDKRIRDLQRTLSAAGLNMEIRVWRNDG